jgi:hypothetical protein
MTWPLVRQMGSAIPGDSFDGWQNYWNLWWMREAWLVEHQSPYVTSLLHYPTGVDLRFQTMAPFNGLVFLNVQLAGNLFWAYNAAVLFSFVIGGYGAYLLALYALRGLHARLSLLLDRRFIIHGAAFVAGVIYAFSPYHFAHLLGHLQLISLQWIPFYVFYLVRGLDRAAAGKLNAIDVLKLALFLVLVGLCDWYYVMYCLLFTALALLVRLAQRQLTWQGLGMVIGATALSGLLLSPLLVPMVQAASTWGGTSLLRDYSESITLSADLLAFLTPQVFHPIWGDWAAARSAAFSATRSEFTVFIGIVVFVLVCIAFCATRKPGYKAASLWLLGGAMFALLALGPVLHFNGRSDLLPGGGAIPLPYAFLYDTVPFIKLSRSVSRMSVMVMLCLGVGAAFGLVQVASWLGKRRRWVALAAPVAAVALILLEFLPVPYPMSSPDTPQWYTTLAHEPASRAVLNLPANWPRPGYLLYQTMHNKPMSTGYVTRDDPRTLLERAPVLSHFRWLGTDIHTQSFDLTAHGMQVLYDLLGVGWVVLDRYKMPSGVERTYTESAAQAIFAAADQAPIFEDDRLTVYSVQEPTQRRPFLVLGPDWAPRQTDTHGQVWRALSGSGSSLEIENPSLVDLILTLTVQGPAGTVLRAVAENGTVVGEWTLTGTLDTFQTRPFAQTGSHSTLRLEAQEKADEVLVHAVDVMAAQ